jgi:PAS domain S-box-containing protein
MEELRHSEERYRRLVELSPDAVLVHCDGTIVYANVACMRLLGAANPDQLLGRPLMEIIHPDYTDIVAARLRQMQEQGVAVPLLEEKLVRLDGQVVNVEVASMPIPYQDSSAYLAVIRDITERLETRTALRAAKEAAESANLAKSQFLANMSHELRTPLNAIIGYSEILREEAEELDYTDFLSDLRKIHTAGKHLLSLINDVLDLAKIEAGKMPPYLEFFDVSTVIHDAVSTIDPLIEKNANTLHVQAADQVGTMYSDITKVRQSLLNLLSNACKFTKEGPITLTVTRETGADKEWLCFQVRDTGIGMSPEQIRRLFQPFLQADASTTRQYGGTGLGLTITQHFCHMLGGTITVESALGEGSTFTMRLPAAALHDQETLETVQPPCTPQPCTAVRSTVTATPLILVIDDDPEARDLLERVLAKEGFQVVTATTGEEGLHLARTLHPTAITLDILMAGMTG